MPYAHNGRISTDPIEGGIEITQDQYIAAIDGMMEGKMVSIDGGFSLVTPEPEEEATEPVPEPAGPLVPVSVTKRQARAALIIRGHEIGRDYIAEVESYLDSMEGVEGLLARDEWHSSSAVERNRPLTIQMAQLLGLTEEQTDDLFIFAATL